MARFRISGTAWDGQRWRLVPCGVVFAQQIEAARPTPHPADGTVAGKGHDAGSPRSDHTVWPRSGDGWVFAIDVGDSEGTVGDMWEALRLSRDPRIMYGIFKRRIFSSYATSTRQAWQWGPYSGAAPHDTHAHLSWQNHMSTGRLGEAKTWELVNDTSPFDIGIGAAVPGIGADDMLGFTIGKVGDPAFPYSARGAMLQLMLLDRGHSPGTIDGQIGDKTRRAMMAFQQANGINLPELGAAEIGPYTASALARGVGGGGGMTQAQADGRYAKIAHTHKITLS